ncbi:MAG: TatD family hydrolase [Dysgonamonadaceae bacterium]
MKLVDTHAHLYDDQFVNDIERVIERAKEAGIETILLPNIDEESISPLKQLVDSLPDFFIPMMGLHPTSVTTDWENQLSNIYEELKNRNYIAVGEIGIDLYWDQSLKNEQIKAFEAQLEWSIENNLPVAIHSRNAINECVESIIRVGASSLRGVFHSFGGSLEELDSILALENFYVGINGVVTYKNSGLSKVLPRCPKEKIVLETDSPYLSPVPYRGKRNESSYLSMIVSKLAEIYEVNDQDIAEITTKNANDLFGISDWKKYK